jgi:hypothetical protein
MERREEDRATATCKFCDTDFVGTNGPGGGKFASAKALADAVVIAMAQADAGKPYVVARRRAVAAARCRLDRCAARPRI